MAVMLVALLIGLAFPPCALMDKGLNEDVVLVPLLRGFANNQIVGLKEVMALGRVLGIKVAMQGIIEVCWLLHAAWNYPCLQIPS